MKSINSKKNFPK